MFVTFAFCLLQISITCSLEAKICSQISINFHSLLNVTEIYKCFTHFDVMVPDMTAKYVT